MDAVPRSLAEIGTWLPPYAADVSRNLEVVVASQGGHLTAQQHWGCILAAAAALRSPSATPALAGEATARMPRDASEAALSVAAVMAGHAVYFRARHFLHGAYDDLRAGLRSSATIAPTSSKLDVELWCVVVAAVHGCEACVGEHEAGARSAGATREAVNDALRIAAVVTSVAAALDADRLLHD